MIDYYRIMLDSGALGWHSFTSSAEAHAEAVKHNMRSKEQRDRGDIVSLRRAVAVVHIVPKQVIHEKRPRKGRKRPACPAAGRGKR